MDTTGSLFLIDSDPDSLEKLAVALRGLGWKVQGFARLADYLKSFDPAAPGCVLLKDFLDTESHRRLQERKRQGSSLQPVIYVPEGFDVASTVDVFRAFTFLLRTTQGRTDSIPESIGATLQAAPKVGGRCPSDELLEKTSAIERRVLALIASGHTNKRILQALRIPPRTFQRMKSSLYQTLGIESPEDLVRINDRLASLPLSRE